VPEQQKQYPDDSRFRAMAIALARRGLGNTWPNPAVGCVLTKGGLVIARGWTQPSGRPHAEAEALKAAGEAARGSTAYVTLEPCSHHGRTPPCCDALIAAGVRRVVIACQDPDARVNGEGIARLQAAGVEVITGVGEAEAATDLQGFLLRVGQKRPQFTLKVATSLDSRIALADGASQWITGPEARAAGHMLRASHDGILIGRGTAVADDPTLTCRLPGLKHRSPVRIVLDSHLQTPTVGRLAMSIREAPLWLFCLQVGAHGDAARRWMDIGASVVVLPDLSPRAVAAALAERGLTRVLIEGGSSISASFTGAGLVDRIEWFRSGSLIGGDGLAALGALGMTSLDACPEYRRIEARPLGKDVLERYVRVNTN